MWFLGVLGRAVKTGRVEPAAFGGPSSTVAQGSLIDSAIRALSGTPLERAMAEAYDPELRNAIQHNDYELIVDDKEVHVSTLDGQQTWHGDHLWKCVIGTSQIVHAVQTVSAYVRTVEEPRLRADHAEVGFVGCIYMLRSTELPQVVLLQLWCFHEMDSAGTWLDAATMSFEQLSDGRTRVNLTERAYTIGEDVRPIVADYKGEAPGWVKVTRVPVAPNLGLGYPTIVRPGDNAEYEVVGVPDVHVIRVNLE
jgi:hypothetical protein